MADTQQRKGIREIWWKVTEVLTSVLLFPFRYSNIALSGLKIGL
jgi:hypothetical protein